MCMSYYGSGRARLSGFGMFFRKAAALTAIELTSQYLCSFSHIGNDVDVLDSLEPSEDRVERDQALNLSSAHISHIAGGSSKHKTKDTQPQRIKNNKSIVKHCWCRQSSDVGCHPVEVGVHVFGYIIPVARRDHIKSTRFRPCIDFVADCNDHHDQIKPVQNIPCIQEVVPPKSDSDFVFLVRWGRFWVD